MAETRDIWFQWLAERRHGGDGEQLERTLEFLRPVRDFILDKAALNGDETLLDVGCGDGLVAMEALNRLPDGQVIFSDISDDLLMHVREVVGQMGMVDRSRFLPASADDLSALPDESVDVVTHRSVLIYVDDKQTALNEFYRVLKPGGRLSFFEPINRWSHFDDPAVLWGYDVTPVIAEAAKVRAVFETAQPRDSDPMLNFDEHDLFDRVSAAGFGKLDFKLEGAVGRRRPRPQPQPETWQHMTRIAFNPKIPTIAEVMDDVLTDAERERFIAHMEREVRDYEPATRFASLYLWAAR